MEFSEKEVREKTLEKVLGEMVSEVKMAAINGSWSIETIATEIPPWFAPAIAATSRIIKRKPIEGYECALMLLEAAKRADTENDKIAAKTMVFDMLANGGGDRCFSFDGW